MDEILQSQTKDSVVSLTPAKLQYRQIHWMLDASQRDMLQVIRLFIAYKLSFIVVSYEQNLCKFKNYKFKPGSRCVSVCVCVFFQFFGKRWVIRIVLICPYFFSI